MTLRFARYIGTIVTVGCSLFLFAAISSEQTLSGSLSNFDVFNDTGHETHGFEIELNGLTSKDVASTFGGTYIRYGDPVLVDFPGGVVVRYSSAYDSVHHLFATATPVPVSMTPTAGHQCWTGGSPGYPSSGCEHFGVALLRNPTAVQYRWLIETVASPGVLVSSGTNVNIAAPLWVVVPGAAGGAAVVNAVIAAPKAAPQQFGDAVWVKVFETESSHSAELNHLLTDDPLVPQNSTQLEVEWELSQSNPKKADNGALQHGKSVGNGVQSVIRRYEFYKYTGAYDPENHEALCGGVPSSGGGKGGSGGGGGGACSTPQPGDIGPYIGAQMAAAQFGAPPASSVSITGVTNSASGQNVIASGAWVSIYGNNLASKSRSWQDSDFRGSIMPTALDDVSVSIDGKPAPISFISPGQVNVQAPAGTGVGQIAVKLSNSSGSASSVANLQPYAPGFFTLQGKYAAAVHADGSLVGPVGLFGAGVSSRPAQPGETLLVFGTGFGPTSPNMPAGEIVSGAATLADLSLFHVRIGGLQATVRFAGMVASGEYQFNIVVPPLADGDQAVVADIAGVSTQPGIMILIKN
jgi:uncharacterized protein (TIGR03437 family)